MRADNAPTPRFVPPPDTIVPTDEQQALQMALQPTVLVEAHAGAAKTTTLALRLAEAWRGGTAPGDCLVLTATNAACLAMRQALRRIGLPVAVAQAFRIATFDSFAAEVLRGIEGAAVPALPTPEQLKPRVWEAVEQLQDRQDDPWQDELQIPALGDNRFVAEFLERMLWWKGTLWCEREAPEGPLTPHDAAEAGQDYTLLRLLRLYEQVRRGGHPDHPAFRGPFDATYDLARHLLDEARGDADAFPAAWPRRLRLLLVDEMHDMNEAMARILMHLLRDADCAFCGVGDVHQVIHSAHGADPAFLRGRIGDDSGRRVARYRLGTSFRFDDKLARRAGRFTGQKIESLCAHETAVGVQAYAGEAACVAQLLAAVQALRKARRRLDGIAILLRHEHHSIALENALVEAGLPYRMAGFESYLLRPEVLLVRGLLAIATRDFASLRDRGTLGKVVEAFVFFCGTRFEEDPEQADSSQAALLATAIRHLHDSSENLPLFLQNIVLRGADAGTRQRLVRAIAVAQAGEEPGLLARVMAALDMPWFIAQALVQPERRHAAARNLDGLLDLAKGFPTAAAFFAQLNAAEERLAGRKPATALALASVAAVKGLEFDHVLLPFLRQGDFPSDRGLPGDEDNLFYVAITRARVSLGLLVDADRPSAFLERMGVRAPAA
ncbi:MAG: ATP-dependent helicase [Pseudomonadota bacterium]